MAYVFLMLNDEPHLLDENDRRRIETAGDLRERFDIDDDYDIWELTKKGPVPLGGWRPLYLSDGPARRYFFTVHRTFSWRDLKGMTKAAIICAAFGAWFALVVNNWYVSPLILAVCGVFPLSMVWYRLHKHEPTKTEVAAEEYRAIEKKIEKMAKTYGVSRVAPLVRGTLCDLTEDEN